MTDPTPSTGAAAAQAGWYTTTPGSDVLRWWDGTRWTDHVYDPATASADGEAARAPEGTSPSTVWFWLIAAGSPLLQLLLLIPTVSWLTTFTTTDLADPTAMLRAEFSPGYFVLLLGGWGIAAVDIVFAALDWRQLKARGVPQPFHWAWSFFILMVGFPAVYVIGRSVVVRRRTGRGFAPLWVFVGLEAAALVTSIVIVIVFVTNLVSQFGDLGLQAGNV
ncbi:MAG: DUF2510 domain-containing protein [Galbitalea sp.]